MSATRSARGAGLGWVSSFVVLLGLVSTLVSAGNYTVPVPPPNGSDDTANLQAALDQCVGHGPSCTVQLAAGRYFTRQLVTFDFRGTFTGRGKDVTIIEALPSLRVDSWVPPDSYLPPGDPDHPWPSLIMFVDGDIHISDLAIQVTAVPSTEPYVVAPGWSVAALIDAIRFMGQHPTNATVERVAIEGREDTSDMGLFGYNLANGITYAGELPTGTGIPFDYYPISGRLTVSASSFRTSGSGVYATIVKGGHITVGGSPPAGNVIDNVAIGMDMESLENTVVKLSHNQVLSATWAAAWAIPWCCGFLPTEPSLFHIHDNMLRPTGEFADGIVLVDDPVNPWIDALVSGNTIEAQDIGYGGISAYNTRNTKVSNNRISGRGANGIGMWNVSHGAVLANEVEDFAAGSAQVVLDGMTSRTTVVCRTRNDTVLNQGRDNRLIRCQQIDNP